MKTDSDDERENPESLAMEFKHSSDAIGFLRLSGLRFWIWWVSGFAYMCVLFLCVVRNRRGEVEATFLYCKEKEGPESESDYIDNGEKKRNACQEGLGAA